MLIGKMAKLLRPQIKQTQIKLFTGCILDPLPTLKSDIVDGCSHGIFAEKTSSIALSKVMSVDQKPSMSSDYTCENTAYASLYLKLRLFI